MTQKSDIIAANEAGADAIGVIFYEKSKRYITVDKALTILANKPVFLNTVAVFVDAEHDFVEDVINKISPEYLQFHGNEPRQFCESFRIPYIKSVKVDNKDAIKKAILNYQSATALLLDSYDDNNMGGTGKVFNWAHLIATTEIPLILAGGLNVSNIDNIPKIDSIKAVDVCSGVEQQYGIKDHELMHKFCKRIKNRDEI